MIFYIRQKLIEVLNYSYPDLIDKYKKFYVVLSYKETSANCKYSFKNKQIIVNNLSRSSGDIFISMLAKLAEHIDIINREETHLDREYLLVFRKLLNEALDHSIIKIDDLKRYSDQKLRQKLQQAFSSFSNWRINEKSYPKLVNIIVRESYMIRNILKTSGYFYDPAQELWTKKLTPFEFEKEKEFIERYKQQAIFDVKSDNAFYITPIYKIKLITYSNSAAILLKSLDYYYDSAQKCWFKSILAANIKQEMLNVETVPKQAIKILENM